MLRPQITLGIAILVSCSLILCAVAADPKPVTKPGTTPKQSLEPTPLDEPTPVDEPETIVEEDQGPWEVTDRVELVFKTQLAVAGDKTLSAKVLLKNTSDTDIPGKLVLVVDGSSIEGTHLFEPQGQFTETTPYLQMIPAKRSLDSGDESAAKTLILTTPETTDKLDLGEATLRWRAYTLTKPAGLDIDPPADDKQVPGKGYTWGEMRRVMSVQDNATVALVEKHNGAILGTGTSEDANGKLVIRVFAAQGGMSRKIPGSIEGVPVELTVTGTIKGGPALSRVILNEGQALLPSVATPEADALAAKIPGGASASAFAAPQIGPPTRRFTRPVPIGVSCINQTGVCASGTLGCRCIGRDGKFYILSNNHVLAEENASAIGDAICQPSPGDNLCAIVPGDVIGTLRDFQRIQFFASAAGIASAPVNTMDAAVALSPIGMVDVCTPAGAYGTPARLPQENYVVGMAVQKQGRTSGFTKGKIYSVNVEAVINYGTPGLARFRNCIDVQTQFRSPGFGAPGDSGSLVVTIADRRPVGILFAGGGFDTFLNPISPVLNRFKVGVDDGTGAAPILGSGRMGSATGPVKQHNNVLPF